MLIHDHSILVPATSAYFSTKNIALLQRSHQEHKHILFCENMCVFTNAPGTKVLLINNIYNPTLCHILLFLEVFLSVSSLKVPGSHGRRRKFCESNNHLTLHLRVWCQLPENYTRGHQRCSIKSGLIISHLSGIWIETLTLSCSKFGCQSSEWIDFFQKWERIFRCLETRCLEFEYGKKRKRS